MTIIHVPAAPGDHVPDEDTRSAMASLLDACRIARAEAIAPTIGIHRIREDACWNLPDGRVLDRHRIGTAIDQRKFTLQLSDRFGSILARCIVDGHVVLHQSDPGEIADCIDVAERATLAVSSIVPGSRDSIEPMVDGASREYLRHVAISCGLSDLVEKGFSADHFPAWPWGKERLHIQSRRFASLVDPQEGVGSFPNVMGVAVTAPEGSSRRVSVRLAAYHMDHDGIDLKADPVARLRDAAALQAAREGSIS